MEELKQGTYKLPQGCVCKVENGVVTIRESKAKRIEDERIKSAILGFLEGSGQEIIVPGITTKEALAWLEKQRTSEEALQYLKENHSPSEMSDFQVAMNIAVAKAYDKGMKDGLEKQGEQKPTVNERAWLYLVSDVLTWKDGIGQYLDDPRVQELAKKLQQEYSQKLRIEKQGEVAIDKEDMANGVLRSAAIHLITWIDYHSAEGNTCLSRIECEDIENALVNADWGKIYSYMKEKLEKEGEQEPITLTKRGAIEMLGTLINIFEVNYPDGFYKVNPIDTTSMQGIHSSEIIKWLKAFRQRMQMVWHI